MAAFKIFVSNSKPYRIIYVNSVTFWTMDTYIFIGLIEGPTYRNGFTDSARKARSLRTLST